MTRNAAQSGVWNGSTWAEGTLTAEEGLGRVVGVRFIGLPSDFLLTSGTLAFTLPTVGVGQVPLTLQVYARLQRAPLAYSTSNHPPTLLELQPLTDVLVEREVVTSTGAVEVLLTLNPTALNAARYYGGGEDPETTDFALHIHARTTNGVALDITPSTLVLSLVLDRRVFTGIEIPWGQLACSRPDFCPICGDEVLREYWNWCPEHKQLECCNCTESQDLSKPRRSASRFQLVNED